MAMRHQRTEQAATPVTEHHEEMLREEAVVREPFGIGQGIALVLGVASVVVGAIALIRTGVNDLTGTTTVVAGLTMTGALALSHIVLGLITMLGAGMRSSAVPALAFVGPALIAAGVIALAQPVPWLGWTEINGIAYVTGGAVALAGAALTPDRAIVEHRTVTLGD